MIGSLIFVLVVVLIVLIVAYAAKYVIDQFLPAPMHTPALLITGVILLLVLLYALATHFGIALK
jgi:hypothetical protein